ncbi:hypothetical protein C3B51_03150 [Pseudoalteromonas rubra]|uniref:Uncharacterized protein n=1 Tax=Pseudoalteromonas rubra TaxID=43658 RepID=A0A4Q7EKT7_9GAMM|nr:hypothetical protein [Pseudoalteromonas rubra]RZM84558.1 hypothetical protein C3B51_03150 [Pseudoalteromonas rubra]
MDFYSIISYATLPTILIALLLTWRFECSRYFLSILMIIELIDEAFYEMSFSWTTHVYLFSMFMNVLFVLPIVLRKQIADVIYKNTKLEYFSRVSENHHFALQEIGIITLCLASFAINLLVYIEVWLYKFYVIDVLFIKNNVRNPVLVVLHALMLLSLLTYVFKTPNREKFYEENI